MGSDVGHPAVRMLDTADTPLPKIAILGRIPYTTMVSGAGSGASRYGEMAINRWRNDSTRDDYGQWCYLKDLRSGRIWSAGHQPVCVEPSSYRVSMANDRVTFHRRDGDLETLTEIVVVPGVSAEARRVAVLNTSDEEAEIELTSYQEIVLATQVSDRGHRAFGNLFVQTEWLSDSASILAMRRPRSAKDKAAWCGHSVAARGVVNGVISFETDRARFIGRGRSSRNPVAMDNPDGLSGTAGAVLDPAMALRMALLIPPGGSAHVIFTTFVARNREEAVRLAGLYHDPAEAEKAFDIAGAVDMSDSGIAAIDAAAYQEMAGLLLYAPPVSRTLTTEGSKAEPGRNALLALGITGESPILLATLNRPDGMTRVIELLTAHWYWRIKGVACDLVIVCGDGLSASKLDDDVVSIIRAAGEGDLIGQPSGVFVRRSDAVGPEGMRLLESVARIRMECGGPKLSEVFHG